MSSKEKLIAKMRNNPRDWQIDTLVNLAESAGIEIRNNGGSHYVFSHPGIEDNLPVPAHRPIKAVYIKRFVALLDSVKELEK